MSGMLWTEIDNYLASRCIRRLIRSLERALKHSEAQRLPRHQCLAIARRKLLMPLGAAAPGAHIDFLEIGTLGGYSAHRA